MFLAVRSWYCCCIYLFICGGERGRGGGCVRGRAGRRIHGREVEDLVACIVSRRRARGPSASFRKQVSFGSLLGSPNTILSALNGFSPVSCKDELKGGVHSKRILHALHRIRGHALQSEFLKRRAMNSWRSLSTPLRAPSKHCLSKISGVRKTDHRSVRKTDHRNVACTEFVNWHGPNY